MVLKESSAVAVLYRDAALFPEPTSTELKDALIEYTNAVITEDWPLQEQEIAPEETDRHVTEIQRIIGDFEPATPTDDAVQSQTVAMLLYAVAGFDHPYSGPISVSPLYFRDLLDGLFLRAP